MLPSYLSLPQYVSSLSLLPSLPAHLSAPPSHAPSPRHRWWVPCTWPHPQPISGASCQMPGVTPHSLSPVKEGGKRAVVNNAHLRTYLEGTIQQIVCVWMYGGRGFKVLPWTRLKCDITSVWDLKTFQWPIGNISLTGEVDACEAI